MGIREWQVRGFQEWRGALWATCHGSLTPEGAPGARQLPEDTFAFVWLRLMRSVDATAAALPAATVSRKSFSSFDSASSSQSCLSRVRGL